MQITSENFTVQNDSEDIFLPDLGIKANRQKHKFLLESDGLDLCKKLLQVPHTQFTITNEGTIRIHIGGLVLDLQAYCEIFVLHEIFFAGIYNILTPKDIVVYDDHVGLRCHSKAPQWLSTRAIMLAQGNGNPYAPKQKNEVLYR